MERRSQKKQRRFKTHQNEQATNAKTKSQKRFEDLPRIHARKIPLRGACRHPWRRER